ncbi:MAG: branched-chain amino acid ABC transporter permease, partial [Burkholderiales bacterium]|nr:branched-chain amino acid ABC transporter permease [Burkholderiales bacterium]
MDHIGTVLVFGLLLGGIYGLVSIGLNLIFGVIRIVNFAQGELVMFGMYGAWFASSHFGL